MRQLWIVGGFFFIFVVLAFQNCAVSNQDSLDYDSSSSTTTTTTSAFSVQVVTYTVPAYTAVPIIASGGTPPYSYTVTVGSGTIASDGTLTPTSTGSLTVLVTDSAGASGSVTLTITAATSGSATTIAPVYYYYNSTYATYYFSTTADYPSGYAYEGIALYTVAYPSSPRVIFTCYNSSNYDYFLSTDSNCEGYTVYKIFGYVEAAATSLATHPLYRCVNSSSKHLQATATGTCTDNSYSVEAVLGYVY